MSDETSSNEPFNLDTLRRLFLMMEEHGVTEVNLKHGDEQWRLRRGHAAAVPMFAAAPPAVTVSQTAASQSTAPAAPTAVVDTSLYIKSPQVGTFYASPSPDDPSFVQVGSKVQPDTIVCIIEAMKVFNQIPAEVSGTIAEIIVNNGDPVEFGQPLFRLNPV